MPRTRVQRVGQESVSLQALVPWCSSYNGLVGRIGMCTEEANYFRYYKRLGVIAKLATSYIDESSQVPVSQALSALCGLKNDARLIIAGDHLQMPPITSIDPPSEAAYLVGSVQTYLQERTFSHPVRRCVLETNYRSNEHSVAFARRIGYPSSLHAAFPDTALHMLSALPTQAA